MTLPLFLVVLSRRWISLHHFNLCAPISYAKDCCLEDIHKARFPKHSSTSCSASGFETNRLSSRSIAISTWHAICRRALKVHSHLSMLWIKAVRSNQFRCHHCGNSTCCAMMKVSMTLQWKKIRRRVNTLLNSLLPPMPQTAARASALMNNQSTLPITLTHCTTLPISK